MKSFSQFGEDIWLFDNVFSSVPGTGTFCDVGAYDGVESSNTLLFENLGWTGLCIEPHPDSWQKCQANRKSPSLCCAIGTQIGDQDFFIGSHPGLSGLQSAGTPMKTFVCDLQSIWKSFMPGPLTLLSVDTEGTELDAIASMGSMRPDIIVAEFWTQPHPKRDAEMVEFMLKLGYKERHRTEANLIFQLT